MQSNKIICSVAQGWADLEQRVSPQPGSSGVDCWRGRLLLLPNGRVSLSSEQTGIQQLTADTAILGTPNASWKPAISGFPHVLVTGHTYTILGTQFNGLSLAHSYGDDVQMAHNYPIRGWAHDTC